MEFKGLTLDKFQVDAINALNQNKSVVVSAPTGSGKTLIADYVIARDVKKGLKVIYTAPIKALSNQKYKEFCAEFGKGNVGIITGDTVINHEAPVRIMTTEIYRNMVITGDPIIKDVSYVILDEIHFINDIERGTVWEESIIFSPKNIRFVCLSATIPNADEFAAWIAAIKKHEVQTIINDKRSVPLHNQFYDSQLGVCTLEEIRDVAEIPSVNRRGRRMKKQRIPAPFHVDLVRELQGKTPCIYFVFSRAACQKKAKELSEKNIFQSSAKIAGIVRKAFEEYTPEIRRLPSAQLLRKTLPYGIGFHHAGLLPTLKDLVEHLFGEGLINVLYATETFAVGINMPAKTVCFESPEKFDGINFRLLNTKEYFQMAGRAGRRGIDKVGYSYLMIFRPTFNYNQIKNLTSKDVLPIKSQFRLSINTVLNLIGLHAKDEISIILKQSFDSYQKYGAEFDARLKHAPHRTFQKMKKQLEKLGYVENDALTAKGVFGSKIFSDEILTTECFGTSFWRDLNNFQILLLIACIAYEYNDKDKFYNQFADKQTKQLRHKVTNHAYLRSDDRFRALKKLTAIIIPLTGDSDFFTILANTNLLEGDLIRFLRQILDRINQIRKAADDYDLTERMHQCAFYIEKCLAEIDTI